MRRTVAPIVVTLALVMPSTAGASFREFYSGPVGNGTNNAGVEFHAKFRSRSAFRNGKPPHKVVDFGWFNVPIPGGCFDSSDAPSGFDMPVNDRRKFHGTFSVPHTTHKAIIHGRFKHHNKKAVGTLRIKGSGFAGGCVNADTGPLEWVAHHGAGE
jgi:hypothetical protein